VFFRSFLFFIIWVCLGGCSYPGLNSGTEKHTLHTNLPAVSGFLKICNKKDNIFTTRDYFKGCKVYENTEYSYINNDKNNLYTELNFLVKDTDLRSTNSEDSSWGTWWKFTKNYFSKNRSIFIVTATVFTKNNVKIGKHIMAVREELNGETYNHQINHEGVLTPKIFIKNYKTVNIVMELHKSKKYSSNITSRIAEWKTALNSFNGDFLTSPTENMALSVINQVEKKISKEFDVESNTKNQIGLNLFEPNVGVQFAYLNDKNQPKLTSVKIYQKNYVSLLTEQTIGSDIKEPRYFDVTGGFQYKEYLRKDVITSNNSKISLYQAIHNDTSISEYYRGFGLEKSDREFINTCNKLADFTERQNLNIYDTSLLKASLILNNFDRYNNNPDISTPGPTLKKCLGSAPRVLKCSAQFEGASFDENTTAVHTSNNPIAKAVNFVTDNVKNGTKNLGKSVAHFSGISLFFKNQESCPN